MNIWHMLFDKVEICPECNIKTKDISWHLLFECKPNAEKMKQSWIDAMNSNANT